MNFHEKFDDFKARLKATALGLSKTTIQKAMGGMKVLLEYVKKHRGEWNAKD